MAAAEACSAVKVAVAVVEGVAAKGMVAKKVDCGAEAAAGAMEAGRGEPPRSCKEAAMVAAAEVVAD